MRLNKRTLAISTATLVVAGGVSAFAYVSAGGTGGGSADTMAKKDVQKVTFAASIAAPLQPGGNAPIKLTTTNPNSFKVTVHTLTVALDGTSVPAGCTASDFTFTPPALKAAGLDVAAGGPTDVAAADLDTVGSVALKEDTSDACLGASLVLTVS